MRFFWILILLVTTEAHAFRSWIGARQNNPFELQLKHYTGSPHGAGVHLGPASQAVVASPKSFALNAAGDLYFINDNQTLLRLTSGGQLEHVAGNSVVYQEDQIGSGYNVGIQGYYADDLSLDASGNIYYRDTTSIYRATPAGVVTYAHQNRNSFPIDGPAGEANLWALNHGDKGHVIVGTKMYLTTRFSIRVFDIADQSLSTLSGHMFRTGFVQGTATATLFPAIVDLAYSSTDGFLYAATATALVRVNTSTGATTLFAGALASGDVMGAVASSRFNNISKITINETGTIYVYDSGGLKKISGGTVTKLIPSTQFNQATVDGPIASAQFTTFNDFVATGNQIYLGESSTIRRITNENTVTTIVGQATAPPAQTGFRSSDRYSFERVVVQQGESVLVVTDSAIQRIQKNGVSTVIRLFSNPGTVGGATLADFPFASPSFFEGRSGRFYFLQNNNLYQVNPDDSVVQRTSGFYSPSFFQIDSLYYDNTDFYGLNNTTGQVYRRAGQGNWVLLGSFGVSSSRFVVTQDYIISYRTFSQTLRMPKSGGTAVSIGPASATEMVLSSGNTIYYLRPSEHAVYQLNAATGVSTIVAGSTATTGYVDANGTSARFSSPNRLTIDGSGNLYVGDFSNRVLRKIDPSFNVTTFLGQSTVPGGVAVSSSGRPVALSKFGRYATTGATTQKLIFAGTDFNRLSIVADATVNAGHNFNPVDLEFDSSGNLFYVDQTGTIGRISTTGAITVLAGVSGTTGNTDGTGSTALFNNPTGLAIAANGDILVADRGNHRIRRVTQAGVVTTIAGSSAGSTNAQGTLASFNNPNDVTVNAAGDIFVADESNNRIRRIDSLANVTNFATVTAPRRIGSFSNGDFLVQHGATTTALSTVSSAGVVTASSLTASFFSIANNVVLFTRSGVESFFTTFSGVLGTTTQTAGFQSTAYFDESLQRARFAGNEGICVRGNNLYITSLQATQSTVVVNLLNNTFQVVEEAMAPSCNATPIGDDHFGVMETGSVYYLFKTNFVNQTSTLHETLFDRTQLNQAAGLNATVSFDSVYELSDGSLVLLSFYGNQFMQRLFPDGSTSAFGGYFDLDTFSVYNQFTYGMPEQTNTGKIIGFVPFDANHDLVLSNYGTLILKIRLSDGFTEHFSGVLGSTFGAIIDGAPNVAQFAGINKMIKYKDHFVLFDQNRIRIMTSTGHVSTVFDSGQKAVFRPGKPGVGAVHPYASGTEAFQSRVYLYVPLSPDQGLYQLLLPPGGF